jgi:hypothetical protein
MRHPFGSALVLLVLLPAGTLSADEGMWLLNRPPLKQLKERYGFEPSPQWLEHVQRSCVRFNDGGSGSFVSADGLVMANQHVGADVLPRLGDAAHNFYRDGFYAPSRAAEMPCPGLDLNDLLSIEDVTQRVNAAVKPGATPEQASSARRAIITQIEAESGGTNGLRGEVVSLYEGSEYHLYRYRRYSDIRVVFAPEQQIAFFGGDPDNFEYPRYDFDVYFFRVYDQGKPIHVEHFLKWSQSGAQEHELVFVAGHPGPTERLNTVAALDYQRQTGFPYLLERLDRLEVLLSAWSGRSDENARQAKELLFPVQDGRKARDGGLAGLLDPSLLAKKTAEEQQLRAAAARDPALKEAVPAWDRIAVAEQVRAAEIRRFCTLEEGDGFNSTLFSWARTLVRAAEESPKPDRDRLSEYTTARRPTLELALFSADPIYKAYETVKLAASLTWLTAELHDEPQFVRQILTDRSPRQRAFELVHGTRLADVAVRKKLYDGGQPAISASRDPMILLARCVDRQSRAVRKLMETQVDDVERKAYAQIAKVRYAVGGSTAYPDATSTLRLTFGTVRGYRELGKQIPFQTTFAGLYQRSHDHRGQPPFDLPQRWIDRQRRLSMTTPFNFVCTADIVGGNSGGPVINKSAEIVGLIFDRNLPSMSLDFFYTDHQARGMAVHSQAITEALRNMYDAGALTEEIKSNR